MATGNSTRPSLRTEQRALTRARMRASAGTLFHLYGFEAVTMEQIAQAAGVSRSTLYLHYPDKGEILADIAALYGGKLCRLVAELPGPVPSRARIEEWISGLAALLARERVPAMLVSHMGLATQDSPAAIRAIGSDLLAALAGRLPHFAAALRDEGRRAFAVAWAEAAMRELGWACLPPATEPEAAMIPRLLVAADIFERFVQAMAKEPQE